MYYHLKCKSLVQHLAIFALTRCLVRSWRVDLQNQNVGGVAPSRHTSALGETFTVVNQNSDFIVTSREIVARSVN